MQHARSRIAPTPSGFLHLGNLYSFVLTWLCVKKQRGKLLLRIDDLDSPRMRNAYLADIFETLAFIGLDYDEGPKSPADFLENYSQQNRLNSYHILLQQLVETGRVYGCNCSRKMIAKFLQEGKTHCPCRFKKNELTGKDMAWRIRVPAETNIAWQDLHQNKVAINLAAAMGDFIIKRRDGLPAYQVASLADDLYYETNFVVRGEDLLASTAAQLYLAELTCKTAFANSRFLHHPLVKSPENEKLSKSAGADSIQAMRKTGLSRGEILSRIATLPGIEVDVPVQSLQQLLDVFVPTYNMETGI